MANPHVFERKNVYKDLDFSFKSLALTRDLGTKSDTNAINQSVKNLVMTNFGERPFHPEIGSDVNALLFEPASSISFSALEDAIETVLNNFEPRISLRDVRVDDNGIDENRIFVRITYVFIEKDETVDTEIILERAR
jgi:phage baseplate assembly protein W|tara:strand:+ start:1283 stop:1693 length:411 start_codon:yes stop_codon:yes gene_type:complete